MSVTYKTEKYETTKLKKLVIKGPDYSVEELLKKGANANYREFRSGRSLLFEAADYRKRRIVELLLQHGAKVDEEDNNRRTPLSIAAEVDSLKIIQTLLKSGAKIDSQDCWGRTPLSYAAEKGHLKVIAFLLDKGADRGLRCDQGGFSPLLYSYTLGQGDLEEVQALLKVDPFTSQDFGETRPDRTEVEERFLDEAWHVKQDWDWTLDSEGCPIFFNIDFEEIKGSQCSEARKEAGKDVSAWRQWY